MTSQAKTDRLVSTPKSAARKQKKARPARGEAFGILNPWGDVWTFDHFKTEADARAYIERFWSMPGFAPTTDTSRFTVVPVKVTVSVGAARVHSPSSTETTV